MLNTKKTPYHLRLIPVVPLVGQTTTICPVAGSEDVGKEIIASIGHLAGKGSTSVCNGLEEQRR